ncbi:MAG: ABC transporter ATP-binding protein [Gammaproteobacteria bacterium]|nr:ABC transporter ATP-binding protein [Gammaproteobacteria bacterium]
MSDLTASDLCVRAGNALLVDDATLTLKSGELVSILGPNGAGKTSLIRAMIGLLPPDRGDCQLNGVDCYRLPPFERAQQVSYLPQRRPLAWPNRVRDIVALGRFAHGAALGRLGQQDAAAVESAMDACDLIPLADRTADTLSGGELARVHFARTLAAHTPLLVADEPVDALDPLHQLSVASLMRNYVDQGGGALVVLHNIALAARISDRLVWMKKGRIVFDGSPQATLTAETMATIFGVEARIITDAHGVDVRIDSALGRG